jgi:uncharacterized protein (TIGR01244 family)
MPGLPSTFVVLALLLASPLAAGAAPATPAAQGPAVGAVQAHALPDRVWVAGQVTPAQLAALAARGFGTVVDLRPDGEAAGQPSSTQMAQAAHAAGLAFAYIPVAHGHIPAAAADQLGRALAGADRHVLVYCASGRRAARTWALAEASRRGGLDEAAILAAVKGAGQDASELQAEIARRVAARTGAR